ncbi:hypothetical protein Yalta_090 [Yalta virus]|nr:hypothetical protein Yalta_090 [Yalta virus]
MYIDSNKIVKYKRKYENELYKYRKYNERDVYDKNNCNNDFDNVNGRYYAEYYNTYK